MSNLTPARLYVEAQSTVSCALSLLQERIVELRDNDEAGSDIPAQMILMVGFAAVALALIVWVTGFGQQAISKIKFG